MVLLARAPRLVSASASDTPPRHSASILEVFVTRHEWYGMSKLTEHVPFNDSARWNSSSASLALAAGVRVTPFSKNDGNPEITEFASICEHQATNKPNNRCWIPKG